MSDGVGDVLHVPRPSGVLGPFTCVNKPENKGYFIQPKKTPDFCMAIRKLAVNHEQKFLISFDF
jgi:hypothetical protein